MAIAGWGFAPCPGRGNTVVLKPAELTPLSALRIGELGARGGLPKGVLQILPGKGSVVGGASWPTPPCARCASRARPSRAFRHGGCAQQIKKRHARARWQERQHRLADADLELAATCALRRVRQARARTAVPARASWSSAASTSGSWRFRAPVAGVVVGDPTLEATEMGRSSPKPTWPASLVRARRMTPGGAPGPCPDGPGTGSPDRAGPGDPGARRHWRSSAP
jgi:hypothetical protein